MINGPKTLQARLRPILLGITTLLVSALSAALLAQALPGDIHPDTLSRLPPVDREQLDDYGKSVYDRVVGRYPTGPITGPASFSPHMPRVADGMDLINQYLRIDSVIGRDNIETAILVAARFFDQQYEWASHEPAALSAGAPQAAVDAIKFNRPTDGLPAESAMIIRFGRELLEENHVSSATWAESVSLFGQQGTLEIAAIIGDYAMAAIILNAIDQQVPDNRPARMPIE